MISDTEMKRFSQSEAAPLVSIGVPVFNGENFIREALDSILNQDCQSLEIIISDNASTDGTQAICESYVRRDNRIKYYRNAENLGVSLNFKRTLTLAQGTYFTWLAHDDSFCDPDYLTKITGFMKEHADVVLCGSSMRIYEAENPRSTNDYIPLPLLPERDWHRARMEFFRWPQTESHYVIYGVYRREVLVKIPMEGRIHRGKPVVVDMEYPILARLSQYGRIVALPDVMRFFRAVGDSSGCRGLENLSSFDHFCLALRSKLMLLDLGLRIPLPLMEKLGLIKVLLGNFFRAHRGRLPQFRATLKEQRQIMAMLQGVCEERLQLIDVLHRELDARLQLINRLEGELKQHSDMVQSLQLEVAQAKAGKSNLGVTQPVP